MELPKRKTKEAKKSKQDKSTSTEESEQKVIHRKSSKSKKKNMELGNTRIFTGTKEKHQGKKLGHRSTNVWGEKENTDELTKK